MLLLRENEKWQLLVVLCCATLANCNPIAKIPPS
jgi:hypothetical protein